MIMKDPLHPASRQLTVRPAGFRSLSALLFPGWQFFLRRAETFLPVDAATQVLDASLLPKSGSTDRFTVKFESLQYRDQQWADRK